MGLCNHDFRSTKESRDLCRDGSQGGHVVCSRLSAKGECILHQCTAESMDLEWEGRGRVEEKEGGNEEESMRRRKERRKRGRGRKGR